jgi:hypothetical protein
MTVTKAVLHKISAYINLLNKPELRQPDASFSQHRPWFNSG